MKRILSYVGAAGLAGTAIAGTGLAATATVASARPANVYVSPGAHWGAPDRSCRSAAFSSIQRAVESVPWGGTVVVCRGVYPTSVTVDRRVNLRGERGAVINAWGRAYGVGVATSWVTVSGLTVENASDTAPGAPADGIVTAGLVRGAMRAANHVTISDDTVKNNKGSGIDLNSTS